MYILDEFPRHQFWVKDSCNSDLLEKLIGKWGTSIRKGWMEVKQECRTKKNHPGHSNFGSIPHGNIRNKGDCGLNLGMKLIRPRLRDQTPESCEPQTFRPYPSLLAWGQPSQKETVFGFWEWMKSGNWKCTKKARGSKKASVEITKANRVSLNHQSFQKTNNGASLVIQWFSSVTQSCPTLCDLVDCRMPDSPVHHHFWSLLKLMFNESVMPSNHLILCCPLLLLPSVFPSIRVFSNESVLRMRWLKYRVHHNYWAHSAQLKSLCSATKDPTWRKEDSMCYS